MNFRVGDTVALKNGIQKMKVQYVIGQDLPENSGVYYGPGVKKGAVICNWTNDDGSEQGGVFNPQDLQLIDIKTVS